MNTRTEAAITRRLSHRNHDKHSSRWAAIGAALAVSIGAGGGIGLIQAASPDDPDLVFVPIDEPCRLIDSRPATQVGPFGAPIGPAETWTINAHNACGIPVTAEAVSINVTGLRATTMSFFTLWQAGAPQPTASNLNLAPGQPPTPNLANVKLNDVGAFSLFNAFGTADAIIDVAGYYEDHDHEDDYLALRSTSASNRAFDTFDLDQTGAAESVLSTTIAAPTAGHVIVNSTALVRSDVANLTIQCAIASQEGVVGTTYNQEWESGGSAGERSQLAGTRGFPVNAGLATYHLNCRENIPGDAVVSSRSITAIFVPGPSGGGS